MTTFKNNNTIFIGFLGLFRFFFSCFYFYLSNTKMQFSFRKPHFWHPHNFAKNNTILTQCDTICAIKNAKKNTIKMGENSEKTWTSF